MSNAALASPPPPHGESGSLFASSQRFRNLREVTVGRKPRDIDGVNDHVLST